MIHRYIVKKISTYADGRLSKEEADKIKQHLDKCPECVAFYEDVLLGKQLTGVVEIEKRSRELDKKMFATISKEMEREKNLPPDKRRIEELLDSIGEYIWSNLTLKKRLAVAAVATFAICTGVFLNVYFSGFKPLLIAKRGDVKIFRQLQDKWISARPGMEIRNGDVVKLGRYAQIDIEAKKLFDMRIKQNSEVRFTKLAKNYGSKMNISVKAGSIMVNTKPKFKGSFMKIVTTTARATVLGTAFIIDVNPLEGGTTLLGVARGKVLVEGIGVPDDKKFINRVIVEEGYKTYIRPGEPPTIPEIFSDREWETMDELYRIGDLPQVALLIGLGPDRVEELMQPCILYIYDKKPRKLSREFDDVVNLIKIAVRKDDMTMHRKAAKRLKYLVRKYPNLLYDVQFYLFLGAYNYFLKDYEEAINSFNKIMDDFPDSKLLSLALCAKAFVYERGKKDKKEAKRIYRYILSFYPNTPEAEYAKNILKKL